MREVLPLAGACLGVILAVVGLVEPEPSLGGDVVALVDERAIGREELESAVQAVAEDLSVSPGPKIRRQVLDRMIDERLLVARAVELGIAESDPVLRTKLGQGVIELVSSSVEEPGNNEVREYYRRNTSRFAHPVRVSLGVLRFNGAAHDQRARAAALEAWDEAQRQADTTVFVPDGLVSIRKLRDYVGSRVADAAGVAGRHVIEGEGRTHLVFVNEVVPGDVPEFELVEGIVRAALRRERGDRALRRYLDDARRAASIRLAPEFR